MKLAFVPLLAAPLLLVACSGAPIDLSSTVPNPTLSAGSAAGSASASAGSSAAGSASGSASGSAGGNGLPSPSGSVEKVLAVLCDKATAEEVALIKGVLKPEFTASQVVDVRTDDDGDHAILAFVEGPGMAVLATWTGTGLTLDGLSSADEFAAQASTAPLSAPTGDLADYVGQTTKCYSMTYGPDSEKNDSQKSDNADN